MYFVRKFGSGLNKRSSDARDKIWAEFHCSLCGEDTDIDVTRVMETFDFGVERRCSHCGMINSADREANLRAQRDKLTADKSRIEVEIERVERELNELQAGVSEKSAQ